MGLKKIINNFLQAIYKIFTGILIITAVLLIIIVVLNIAFNLALDVPILILFAGIAIAIIYYVSKNRNKIADPKNSIAFLFFEILKLGFFAFIFFTFVFNIGKIDSNKLGLAKQDETVRLHTDSSDVRLSRFYLSQQSWTDFNRNRHTLPFKVNYDDVIESRKNRNDFKITYQFTWGKFYKILSDNDRPLVEELAQAFYNYQKEEKMNRRDFAELMITAIQDIPYSLILNTACDSLSVKPCYGKIKLGVFAPAEFVSNLTGDCDTRTVLLFTLLSRFNYDIAILNSEAYRHSVLGINMPSTGKFKTHKNKKYYFIETTARGCPIGYLHQDVSDVSKWDFALIHTIKN